MTAKNKSICTVCSLLCPLAEPPMMEPSRGHSGIRSSVTDCSMRNRWIDLRSRSKSVNTLPKTSLHLSALESLKKARRPLIWIEGADVETVRSAVELARFWPATLHVAQSIGSKVVSRVTCADGWFGTTLADAARHSQLLITLGTRWMQSMPLLVDRFFGHRENLQWWSIQVDKQTNDLAINARPRSLEKPLYPTQQVVWPRQQWISKLSELVQLVQASDSQDDDTLAAAILQSPSTTILWDKTEIQCDTDESVVILLQQLAKNRSTKARFSLLPINNDSGRETAEAALLWLTGCASTAKLTSDGWISPSHYQHYSLADWRAEFDFILAVRNTPSIEPITINADLLLCSTIESVSASTSDLIPNVISVGMAGVDHDALLFRGDHGMTCFAPATSTLQTLSTAESTLPTVAQLLRQTTAVLTDIKRGSV